MQAPYGQPKDQHPKTNIRTWCRQIISIPRKFYHRVRSRQLPRNSTCRGNQCHGWTFNARVCQSINSASSANEKAKIMLNLLKSSTVSSSKRGRTKFKNNESIVTFTAWNQMLKWIQFTTRVKALNPKHLTRLSTLRAANWIWKKPSINTRTFLQVKGRNTPKKFLINLNGTCENSKKKWKRKGTRRHLIPSWISLIWAHLSRYRICSMRLWTRLMHSQWG